MSVGDVVPIMEIGSVTNDLLQNTISELGKVGLWIQAVGLVVILWIVFQIVIIIQNRFKRKRLISIEHKLDLLSKKIDRIKNKK